MKSVKNDKTVTQIEKIERLVNDEYQRNIDNNDGMYEVNTNQKMLKIRSLQNQKITQIDYLVGKCAQYDELVAEQIKHTQKDIDNYKHKMELLLGHRVVAIAGMVATKEKIDYTIAKVMAYATFFTKLRNGWTDDKYKTMANRIIKIVYNMLVTVENNYELCCKESLCITGKVDESKARSNISMPTYNANFRDTHVKYIECSGCGKDINTKCNELNHKLDELYRDISEVSKYTQTMNRLVTLMTRYNRLYMLNSKTSVPELLIIQKRIDEIASLLPPNDDVDTRIKNITKIRTDYLVMVVGDESLKNQVIPIIELIDVTLKESITVSVIYSQTIKQYDISLRSETSDNRTQETQTRRNIKDYRYSQLGTKTVKVEAPHATTNIPRWSRNNITNMNVSDAQNELDSLFRHIFKLSDEIKKKNQSYDDSLTTHYKNEFSKKPLRDDYKTLDEIVYRYNDLLTHHYDALYTAYSKL